MPRAGALYGGLPRQATEELCLQVPPPPAPGTRRGLRRWGSPGSVGVASGGSGPVSGGSPRCGRGGEWKKKLGACCAWPPGGQVGLQNVRYVSTAFVGLLGGSVTGKAGRQQRLL